MDLTEQQKEFLNKAFERAQEALASKEVPVGCIFVLEDKEIVAIGRNEVNETKNATRHAELVCIDQVVDYCTHNRLEISDCFKRITVYVTVEPCIMCAAALYDLQVGCVIYGCKNDRFGGTTVFNVAEVLKPVTCIKGGYRAEEAMSLLKEFYKGTNPSAPPSKVKVKSEN